MGECFLVLEYGGILEIGEMGKLNGGEYGLAGRVSVGAVRLDRIGACIGIG